MRGNSRLINKGTARNEATIAGYDAEGQLTAASYEALTPAGTPTGAKRTESFVYDALGNRKGLNVVAGRGAVTFYRTDNGLNQYSSWTPSIITYDDDVYGPPGNGVMMQEGNITAFYNAINQPTTIFGGTLSAGMNFGFDPLGRCVKRWVSASGAATTNPATYLYYDGWNLIQEGTGAAAAERIYLQGNRVDRIVCHYNYAAAQWRYHHYDARGHCILLTDPSGDLVEQYEYDAFGKPYFYNGSGTPLPNESAAGNRFLFTGREWLSDLKLYDYRNRLYQPELGRFLQPDPKHFEAGDYNLYRYCHNDPVNRSDPMGLADADMNDRLKKFGEGVGSYLRGIGRGIDALAASTGIKGEEAKAEQQQAMKDIADLGKRAVDNPKIAGRAVMEAIKLKMRAQPEKVEGRVAAGFVASQIHVRLGRAAVPLGAITTPLAIYGDAMHMAITVRQHAQTLQAEHLLDSVLSGGSE